MADRYTATTLTAFDTSAEIKSSTVERRPPAKNDVFIRIHYCGICHSDLHQIRGEWACPNYYPMTPGHEIVGVVEEVGPQCTKYKVGDRVGVGCFVDSCLACDSCKAGDEQYCQKGVVATYNSQVDGKTNHGGYSTVITVREEFVVKVPDSLPLGAAAPLLCAGITTYSPLVHFGAKAGGTNFRLAVLGIGGLGHVALKLGKAFGNHVTALSRGSRKKAVADRLGCAYLDYTDEAQVAAAANSFDMILDTVSANHDVVPLFSMLRSSGKYVVVGVPPEAFNIPAAAVIFRRLTFAGSLVGGIRETQEVLDFCAAHNITVDVELIEAKDVNHAMHKLAHGHNEMGRYVIKIQESLTPGLEVEKEPASDPRQWKALCFAQPPEANIHATLQ